MSIQIPADVQRAAIDRIRAGETHLAIAADLGLSRHTVDKVARIHGHSRRRKADLMPPPSLTATPPGDLSWMSRGLCRDNPHFTDKDTTIDQQKAICWSGCPVRMECLDYGLAGPSHGVVFGGLSPQQLTRRRREEREQQARADRMRREVGVS